ncbi:sigma 54-interacting transcriptional regulator, partial [Shewanella sp. A25]|nr:sigma 54-interacting transcriptional regulator [Shewanella shenzhenensis]
GGTSTISVNVRIIAATNRNLEEEVSQGTFREDLYYRLNVMPMYLPPLRERTEDLPELAEHMIKRLGMAQQRELSLT